MGGAQALERGLALRARVAEHAHVDAGMAQVWAGLTAVTVTNPTRGSFRSVAIASLSTCAHGLVHPAHAVASVILVPAQVAPRRPSRALDARRPAGSGASSQPLERVGRLAPARRVRAAGERGQRASRAARGPGGRPRPRTRRRAARSCALTGASSARLAFRLPASGKCRWMLQDGRRSPRGSTAASTRARARPCRVA